MEDFRIQQNSKNSNNFNIQYFKMEAYGSITPRYITPTT